MSRYSFDYSSLKNDVDNEEFEFVAHPAVSRIFVTYLDENELPTEGEERSLRLYREDGKVVLKEVDS